MYNITKNRNVLLHHNGGVLGWFGQDGKIKIDRMMKLITRGGKVSRFFLLSRVAIPNGEKVNELTREGYQILKLTDDFYKAYPNPPYKEILKKKQRAYNCLLFQSGNIMNASAILRQNSI